MLRDEKTLLFRPRWPVLAVAVLAFSFQAVSAQSHALVLFGHGGRLFPFLNLSATGDDLSGGKAFGGGVGLQLGPGTALRASLSFSECNLRGPTVTLADPSMSRAYYGADLMLGYPLAGGFAPYIFVGGGRVTIDPAETGVASLAKPAGRLGAGLNYVPENAFLVLFVELSGWAYQFDLLGFDRLQIDTALLGGVAVAVPF